MKKTYCDRCGAEILPGEKYMVEAPRYFLERGSSTILNDKVDLCKDCMVQLKEWFEEKK